MFTTPSKKEFESFVKVFEDWHLETNNISELLETMVRIFNTNETNPLVHCQQFIRMNNTFTSVSVGCIIAIEGVKYAVAGTGFEKLDF